MRRKRLYTRIYLHGLGVLIVVGLAITGVFSIGQRGAFLREVTVRLARHLAAELGERFADSQARHTALLRLHRDFELDLAIRDLQGRQLAVAGTTFGGNAEPRLAPDELLALQQGQDVFQHRKVVAAAPIRAASGEIVGILQMAPPQRFRSFGMGSLRRPLLAVGLVLFLVALVSWPLSRRISRPVELLTAASRRLGAGELSYRIPISGWNPPVSAMPCQRWHGHMHHHALDEMAELLHAWNDMADRIERLLRGQRELLANVSHELRSPLTRVRVALALLPREGEGEARLSEVEADLGELERLIEDVLMTARLDAIGLPTRPEPQSLRPLLLQVVERAQNDPLIATKQVQLADGPDLSLRVDGNLLKRALFNLLENAAKYGASPIVLSAQERGNMIEIAVSDLGAGIPAVDRERVFEPFYRRDTAHTPQARPGISRGFGLGLTLARRVAEAHGGTIAIAAQNIVDGVEHGCRITLRLPYLTA